MEKSVIQDYLFYMVHEHVDFRLPELESICELIGKPNCILNHNYSNKSAVFTCQLFDDQTAIEIAKRSFLLKTISRLYCQATSFESLLLNIESSSLPVNINKNDTFKIEVHSFGKNYTQAEKIQKIEKLVDALKFTQDMKVCMNNDLVKHRFIFVEDWVIEKSNKTDDQTEKKTLKQCYFGRFVCDGQSINLHKYNLKDRGYIGNTSMDPLLSLVMSNMGKVKPNDFVYDPFVGTGSILVAAAHFGGYVSGADLDYNLIHSRGLSSRKDQKYRRKDQNIQNNLKQYGLDDKYVDIMVADFATKYIRHDYKFDSIITDPPYGIREKAKKLGAKKQQMAQDDESLKDNNDQELNNNNFNCNLNDNNNEDIDNQNKKQEFSIRQHTKYMLGEIFNDLLIFAAIHLNYKSRLVFWLPVYLEIDRESISISQMNSILKRFIPTSKYLNLTSFSEQRLSMHTSRLLVTMTRNQIDYEIGNALEEKLTHSNFSQNKEMNINETEAGVNETINYLNNFRDNYFTPKK